MPVTQTEMMRRLLKQIYAQLDERNDCSTLEEWAKFLQSKALDSFEWLVRARVALKSVFLGQYLPEEAVKSMMEQILLKCPKVEIMDHLRGLWANKVDDTIQREGAKAKKDTEDKLACLKRQVKVDYLEELERHKVNR